MQLRRFEELEALKELKYRYCQAADDNYNGAVVAALVTEDGIWDGGNIGRYEGRTAMAGAFLIRKKGPVALVSHQVSNPYIEIDGG